VLTLQRITDTLGISVLDAVKGMGRAGCKRA
jgi:hypothetical protein